MDLNILLFYNLWQRIFVVGFTNVVGSVAFMLIFVVGFGRSNG
jgi:hypothetical protein